jgi:hypothetical protein
VEQNQAAIGRAVRRSRRQVEEEGRIEGLEESERQASAAGHDRGRSEEGERGEVVRQTRPGSAQSVVKRGTQDGGRVGRVGLKGGPSDRMGEQRRQSRGGQRVLIDVRRGPNRIGRRQTRRGSAPRCITSVVLP